MTLGRLDKKILEKLKKKTNKAESTIRKDIALLGATYGKLTPNARAQIYALQNGISVRRRLSKEEKESLPNLEIEKPSKITQKGSKQKRKKIIEFIKYETNDSFILAHIHETNKAYTFGCFTAAYILCRKILENLITDIIIKKFPKEKKTTEMYFDTKRGRRKDFSEIIDNLKKRAKDFDTDKELVDRILTKSKHYKDDANKKTHSWYHIVRNKKEIDDTNVQDILMMLKKLDDNT